MMRGVPYAQQVGTFFRRKHRVIYNCQTTPWDLAVAAEHGRHHLKDGRCIRTGGSSGRLLQHHRSEGSPDIANGADGWSRREWKPLLLEAWVDSSFRAKADLSPSVLDVPQGRPIALLPMQTREASARHVITKCS
eukprot:3130238-Amphidinium_carterae.1